MSTSDEHDESKDPGCQVAVGQAEPGSIVWHRNRDEIAVYLGVSDLDTTSAIVDFERSGEARVSISQLTAVLGAREAQSWEDTFAAARASGTRSIAWSQPLPSDPYTFALIWKARLHGFLLAWEPNGERWDLKLTDLPSWRATA